VIATCKTCRAEFDPVRDWQLNCVDCWNRRWQGLPSSEETRLMLLSVLQRSWTNATDLVRRSQMPSSAIWPEIAQLAMVGQIEVASIVKGQYVPCGPSTYTGQAWIRRAGP
jgi:hypothetical protein